MRHKIIATLFFGNYFVALLAIALSVETCLQLNLPLNNIFYYGLLFEAVLFYYTYTYITNTHAKSLLSNPRTQWYARHRKAIQILQKCRLAVVVILALMFFIAYCNNLGKIPIAYYMFGGLILLSGIFYYGLLPGRITGINLRNTGWFKAFTIGLVWAGTVTFFPVLMHALSGKNLLINDGFLFWFFVKNWMFCTVNAIMFDIKDYEDDSNRQLQTFVVRAGMQNTIRWILLPLSTVGLLSLLIFARYNHFPPLKTGINLIPFFLLFFVVFSLNKHRSLMYYLIVIDGLIMVKAICGIFGKILTE